MGGVEYQVTKVDPTDPHTKGAVYQVHKVSEEIAATLGGKVYRARIINDPTAPTVAGKVYQIVLIGDPSDPAVKGKVYNAILTGGSEATVVGPAVSPLELSDAIADSLTYVKAFGGTEQNGTPTPDAPIDIVSNNGVLKFSLNEFDPNAAELGYYRNANTGAKTESLYNFLTAMMPVKPSTSYVLFGRRKSDNHLSAYNRIYWFDSNQNFISTSSYSVNTVTVATSPANAAYAQGGINESGGLSIPTTQEIIDDYNWVFQPGTAEVPYTPYSPTGIYTDGTIETIEDTIGNTATAEMLLGLNDKYRDEQNITTGAITRNVGVKVLDGTEDWVYNDRYNRYNVVNFLPDAVAPNSDFLCTHGVASISTKGTWSIKASGTFAFYDDKTIFATEQDFKDYLADQYANGTPVIVIYPLATATTESVAGQTLQVQQGDNILEITQASLDNLELEAKYEKEAE